MFAQITVLLVELFAIEKSGFVDKIEMRPVFSFDFPLGRTV